MLMTIIICSHNKPEHLPDAVQSVLTQTYQHWQALLVDSGYLTDLGFFAARPWLTTDPRVTLLRSVETDEIRQTRAMAPWIFNECHRSGLVKGDLVIYLADDDYLYDCCFQTFVDFFTEHPEAMAAYASQDLESIGSDGRVIRYGERIADRVAGRCVRGAPLDCWVDYLQFCHRREALAPLAHLGEYWAESLTTASHADGIFMERIGEHFPIHPINIKVSVNRRTPSSLYTPSR